MNNKKRSFFRLIQNPGEDFRQKLRAAALLAPLAAGFLATLLFIALNAVGEIFCDATSFALYSGRLGLSAMRILAFSILPTFVVLKLLELYVCVRLKMTAHRDERGQ